MSMSVADHLQQTRAAFAGFTISVGAASVSWVPIIDFSMRVISTLVAVATGIAALVYYGRQNGWWK